MVGADIISTITAPLTFQSVAPLGGIVLIRTFLSFSLETEIEGCWHWQRAGKNGRDPESRAGEEPSPEAANIRVAIPRVVRHIRALLPATPN